MSGNQPSPTEVQERLQAVLAEAADVDCESLRKRRLRAVTKARRARLEQELALLDSVLSRLLDTAPSITLEDGSITEDMATADAVFNEPEVSMDETPGLENDSAMEPVSPPRELTPVIEMPSEEMDPEERRSLYRENLVELSPPTDGWQQQDEILFDDALRLFRLGDSEGALVSLERLLLTSNLNEDLSEFIVANEDRLVDLYETRFGSFHCIVELAEDGEPMPSTFRAEAKVVSVLEAVNGARTYDEIMNALDLSRLEVVMVLSQLLRLGSIASKPEN